MFYFNFAQLTRRVMWRSGIIARKIEFKTTCKPKAKVIKRVSLNWTDLALQKLGAVVEALERHVKL